MIVFMPLNIATATLSIIVLILSIGAACELPDPRFCCYRTANSDAATLPGILSDVLRIRVLNLVVMVQWFVLLGVEVSMGYRSGMTFYIFMGLSVMHPVMAMVIQAQLPGGHMEGRPRGGPSQLTLSTSSHDMTTPPAHIPMRRAEVVLVINPDYVDVGDSKGSGPSTDMATNPERMEQFQGVCYGLVILPDEEGDCQGPGDDDIFEARRAKQ